jgi:hypothetical protein
MAMGWDGMGWDGEARKGKGTSRAYELSYVTPVASWPYRENDLPHMYGKLPQKETARTLIFGLCEHRCTVIDTTKYGHCTV